MTIHMEMEMDMDMDDSRIVDLFLERDESAISFTAQKYGSRLRSISLRITEDYSVAQECENETYLEAWNRIPPNEPRAYLPAFLFRIVRNLSINRCVEKHRMKRCSYITELSLEMEQCIPDPNDTNSYMDGVELGRSISAYLQKQSEEKRVIFLHRYYYLDSISAIAKRFGYSQSKIKTMLFRMRKDLRMYLIKEGYEL